MGVCRDYSTDISCNRKLMRNGPEKTLIEEIDQNNSQSLPTSDEGLFYTETLQPHRLDCEFTAHWGLHIVSMTALRLVKSSKLLHSMCSAFKIAQGSVVDTTVD